MIDTTKPPNRPTSSRPRPSGRDGSPPRGGDKPRSRTAAGDRDAPSRRDPTAKTRGAEPAPPKDDARIAKVMARAGLCSRRDAEGWIAAGRVAVNGVVIDSPALNVKAGDKITVDGEPLPEREQTRLYMFHKPRGLVTTARDPEGRPTIFDHLPEGLPRVVSIGRLDINTEGLMLLTNDGGLARVLELPQTGWLRRYRVRANGAIDQARLDQLKTGITIDGIDYAGIEATLDRIQGANVWMTMGLREGKNREIKRVLESLGLAVTRLIRISFGPFQLGELAEGAVESVPTRVLREQLGPGLAAQAGVDFEMREEPTVPSRGRRDAEGVAPARPSRSEPAAPRPHVGAMRAAREEAAGEGRKRIERGATADRKGRAVKVERVVPVVGGAPRDGDSRNARRFAAQHQDGAGERQKTRADAGRPTKRVTGFAAKPRREAFGEGDRAERGARSETGTGEVGAAPRARTSPGRGERIRSPRPAKLDGDSRSESRGGFGVKPFASKPRGERTASARSDAASAAPRSPRPDGFTARPRRDADAASGGDNRGERRSGSGAKSFGAKSFGAKPFASKPRGERTAPARSDDASAAPRSPRPDGFTARPRRDADASSGGDNRGERRSGFGAKSFGAKSFAPRGDRAGPARSDDASAAPRSPRPSSGFAARPPRSRTAEGGEGRGEGRGGFGAKPAFGARSAAPSDKPRTGKPNSRPGGFSSERPATGRNKPAAGDRPSRGGKGDGGKGGGFKGGGRPPRGRP
ncbi:MAG: pseudouridine synthase [Janthinobacterium lividum]